jgi:hypothetical protein
LARAASTLLLVVLLAATAGALALTGRARVDPSPIYGSTADPVFSPECNCDTSVADIDFRLRATDHLTIWLERDGKRVRTLVHDRKYAPGGVSLVFDGISDKGLTLEDGSYRPVVHLASQHRRIELPTPISLDTKPPDVRVRHRIYSHVSPDGDGRRDVFRVPFRLGEQASGLLLVDGRQVANSRSDRRGRGVLVWDGKLNGRTARAGNHVLEVSAEDAAGNRAKPFPFAVLQVRYVSLGRTRILAAPKARFAVLVLTDAPAVRWRFARATGVARPGTLRLRAPRKRGVYRLYVTASGHTTKALVVVA